MSKVASAPAARPLVFGEVLFDRFDDGATVLGGAPFNVTWHLRALGLDPLLVSRVGSDALGTQVRARMRAAELDDSRLQLDPHHPTGTVRVTLEGAQPRFEILPEQAYDFIDEDAAVDLGGERIALLYHGSLAARHAVSAAALARLRHLGAPAFIDVNLRPPWWDAAGVERLLAGGRWLKINDDELRTLVRSASDSARALAADAARLRERHKLEVVIVTCGADGALAVTADGVVEAEPIEMDNVLDTVGAGDGFSAVSILGLLRGWDLERVLERANRFAAAICGLRGAVPDDADFYRRFTEEWNR